MGFRQGIPKRILLNAAFFVKEFLTRSLRSSNVCRFGLKVPAKEKDVSGEYRGENAGS